MDPEKKVGFQLPNDHWINRPISDADDHTLLMQAIRDKKYDFVKVLLKVGGSASLKNTELGIAPIHIAARKNDVVAMKLLFEQQKNNKADVNAKVKSSGRTALHICVENDSLECVEYLLNQRDVVLDVQDLKGDQTPLYLAVQNENLKMIQLLLEHGANSHLVCFGEKIADIIKKKFPTFDPETISRNRAPLNKLNSISPLQSLATMIETASISQSINEQDVEHFQSVMIQYNSNDLNEFNSGGYTLLQKAVEGKAFAYVESLLDQGNVDANGVSQDVVLPPIFIATRNGDVKAMKVLLKHGAMLSTILHYSKETVLHYLLKNGRQPGSNYEAFDQCVELLLGSKPNRNRLSTIINKRDAIGNTALHYASEKWDQTVIRALLEMGANIGMKNQFDDVPINKISCETMEAFLDGFCVTSNNDVNHEDFELTFNYSFLAPPVEDLPIYRRPKIFDHDDMKSQKDSIDAEDKIPLPETLSLWFMSKSREHRHLLKHPVIASFLHLKWTRMRRAFNRNMRFYFVFVYILTWYIFAMYGDLRTQNWHIVALPLGIIMLIFVVRDILLDIREAMQTDSKYSNGISKTAKLIIREVLGSGHEMLFTAIVMAVLSNGNNINTLWISLMVLSVLLILREVFQLFVSMKRYFSNVENLLEIFLIAVLLVMLFKSSDIELGRHLSGVLIILSWAELITLVGKHPMLTKYNVYLIMFYKVLGTFFSFLCWYVFFIVGFGLAFYIMFHKTPEQNNDSASEEEDPYIFFDSPWLALVKTSTMFVGELEFSDIPVNLGSPLASLDYVFFLGFVFLIVVVLMNLLNGLAVSDTGLIQQKAEYISYSSIVETISYTESVLLGDPFQFLSSSAGLQKISKRIPNFSLCSNIYRNNRIRAIYYYMTGAADKLLFYDYLPEKKITLTPNARKATCDVFNVSKLNSCPGQVVITVFPQVVCPSFYPYIIQTFRIKRKNHCRLGLWAGRVDH